MRTMMPWLAIAGLLAVPVEAHAAQYDFADARTGSFVGARLQMPLGGHVNSRPRASLTLAPTFSRPSSDGEVRTSIGEGVAFSITPGAKPTLTLAGMRADAALGLQRRGGLEDGAKLGISSGGWVAIGVGVVAVAGGIYFIHLVDEAEDNSD